MLYKDLKYLVSKPNDFDEEIKYPTVIFMHGAGTRGEDIDKIKENPFYNKNNILLSKAIVYAPLCDADTWFDLYKSILEFVHYVYEHKNTDKSRMYLVGASIGAYAVWQMLMSEPELYAGAVPICGGGMYCNSERLKDINIWAFHGKKDGIVLCEESIKRGLCPENIDGIEFIGENISDFVVKDFVVPKTKPINITEKMPKPLYRLVNDMLQPYPDFDKSKCIGCGRCAANCPPKALSMKDGRPSFNKGKCIRCFCCQELCPAVAVDIKRPIMYRIFSSL